MATTSRPEGDASHAGWQRGITERTWIPELQSWHVVTPTATLMRAEVCVASLDEKPLRLHRLAYWLERGGRNGGSPTRITAGAWHAWERRLARERKEAPTPTHQESGPLPPSDRLLQPE